MPRDIDAHSPSPAGRGQADHDHERPSGPSAQHEAQQFVDDVDRRYRRQHPEGRHRESPHEKNGGAGDYGDALKDVDLGGPGNFGGGDLDGDVKRE